MSARQFLVRSATPADIPRVLPMVRAICDLHQTRDPERFKVVPDVLDRYARWLPERATDPRSVFLVAQSLSSSPSATTHADLCGFLVGTIEKEVPIFWVPECGWIHDLWVEPAARRLGVARELAAEAVARFAAMGQSQVRLHTGAFNDSARELFSSVGFRPCVVEMLKSLS